MNRNAYLKGVVLVLALLFSVRCSRSEKAAVPEAKKADEKKDSMEVVVPIARQTGIIQVETVAWTNQPDMVQAPGVVTLPDTASWRIGVITTGRIETVNVNLGDLVSEGQVLARMYSQEVHDARAVYATSRSHVSRAESDAALAQKNLDRAEKLYSLKAGSLADVERTRQELVNAQAAVRDEHIEMEKERTRLRDVLGVVSDPDPTSPGREADLIPIHSTGAGYVLAKNVTPGTVIDPSKDLFVIGDLKHLWMVASVGDADISKMQVGRRATVTVKAFPNASFSGKITNLSPQLDPVTRVMNVRIELDNPGLKLRPEMLAMAHIESGGSQPRILIPADSVQQINGQDVVFVRKSEDRFEVRPVHLGEIREGQVEILEGLKPDENVVIRGSFVLKSQLLKASIEESD